MITADTAASFRDQLARRQPSLILLDLQMPGMDGIEALRYIGRQGVTSGILLASGMDQRVLASARQLGDSLGLKMLGTLQKPAMLEEIETLLAKHLEPGARISVDELRQAIEEHELLVHYQPKVRARRAATGRCAAPKRWCAGGIRGSACSIPASSCRWRSSRG